MPEVMKPEPVAQSKEINKYLFMNKIYFTISHSIFVDEYGLNLIDFIPWYWLAEQNKCEPKNLVTSFSFGVSPFFSQYQA